MANRRFVFLLFTLTVFVSASCQQITSTRTGAPANTEAGEVAFELAGPNGAAMLVPVTINGQGPFNLVLDTGATFTCVDQKIVEQLKLPERGGQLGIGAGIRGSGQVRLVSIESLQVGTAKASDLTACALDLQHMKEIGVEIQGLLGLNFLKSFRVTIDFDRKILQLQKP